MRKVEQRISPAAFAKVREELQRMEALGYGPDAAALNACRVVGLEPTPGTETVFVVDNSLTGTIYPFMTE